MSLFNLFKKKESSKQSTLDINDAADFVREQKSKDKTMDHRNFIDDLVSSFKVKEHVIDAFLGFVQFANAERPNLFLSVGLTGEEDSIKSMSWFIKSVHFPKAEIHFASNLSEERIYDYIKSSNFPFYQKGEVSLLSQKILKQWFEPEKYKEEFISYVKQTKVVTLVKDVHPLPDCIHFQTYIRKTGEFIPLFSDMEMIEKSGMTEIPSALSVLTIDFKEVNESLSGFLNNKFFVMNPGTPFEVEFYS